MSGEVTIGRDPACSAQVADARASRRHAQLRVGEHIELTDLGGKNGTVVDGRQLRTHETVRLESTSIIRIGSSVILFEVARTPHPERWVFAERIFRDRVAQALSSVSGELQVALIELRWPPESWGFSTTSTEGAETIAMGGRIRSTIERVLGPDDIVSAHAPNSFRILLGNTTVERARHVAIQLNSLFLGEGIDCEVGLGVSGIDGKKVDALVAAAGRPWAGTVGSTPPAVMGGVSLNGGVTTRVDTLLSRLDATDATVLIVGETGVGKEIMARSIHARSRRASEPMLTINCATLTESLFESELFGHERGAFTGAHQARAGLLESANEGTLFFDEIGELPLGLQAKLLRILEHREVTRVGSTRPRATNVRFLFATNRDLAVEVQAGRFRDDLFYRLSAVTLRLAPLRERRDEIEPLTSAFIQEACRLLGRSIPFVSDQARQLLQNYAFPGNVRELKNIVNLAVLVCDGDVLAPSHLPVDRLAFSSEHPTSPPPAKDEVALVAALPPAALNERERIITALEECAWNQTTASKILGMPRRTLVKRLAQYGIPRPRAR